MEKVVLKVYRCLMIAVLLTSFSSCTNWQYIDTGLANGNHNMTMMEYFATDDYNWELTVQMIKHAGMESEFSGSAKNMTFLAPTSNSIRSYVYSKKFDNVSQLDVQFCKDLLQKLIIPKVILRDDPPRGKYYQVVDPETELSTWVEEGGTEVQCVKGSIWMYTYQESYNNVPAAGEVSLNFLSRNIKPANLIRVASTNIMTNSGAVQALPYDFKLEDI